MVHKDAQELRDLSSSLGKHVRDLMLEHKKLANEEIEKEITWLFNLHHKLTKDLGLLRSKLELDFPEKVYDIECSFWRNCVQWTYVTIPKRFWG